MTIAKSALLFVLVSLATVATADTPAVDTSLVSAAEQHRLRLQYKSGEFSGPAMERLLAEGAAANFFLVGEEHGIAENPKLVAQLFAGLTGHGYSRFAIEISPTLAQLMDKALVANGLDGLRELFAKPGGEPAFFGMAEEAQMLATIRELLPDDTLALWGTDYEVAGDRQLLGLLAAAEKPAAAEAALQALADASRASWKQYADTGNPQFIFSFAGDPAMVRAVREQWPEAPPSSAVMLNTLEQTLAINRLWVDGRGWESNRARARLMRENFLRYWRTAKQRGSAPKVMAKYGASHMVRGLSPTAVYDLGTLLPEIAAIEGGHSFSLLVVPGKGTQVAVLDPSAWRFRPQPATGGYLAGLEPLLGAAFDDAFTLIDLRPLRSVIGMKLAGLHPELVRAIHGFDMLLVMTGSTPSTELEHVPAPAE